MPEEAEINRTIMPVFVKIRVIAEGITLGMLEDKDATRVKDLTAWNESWYIA